MKAIAKKKTVTERSAETGISTKCLNNWKASGIKIMDDDDLRSKLKTGRSLPPNLKPEYHPQTASLEISDNDDPTQIDIEKIIAQISTATDKHSAQTVKTQIDALVNAYKLREAAGKYVSKSTVEEALIRIGATFKAALLRMEADHQPHFNNSPPR